jgi:F-type H+-transporting ATPase subunit gamma
MIYNHFISTISSKTVVIRLLPLSVRKPGKGPDMREKKWVPGMSITVEPEYEDFIKESAGLYVQYRLKIALLNSILSEHSSRMTAMENATNNSEDLIYRYNKTLNRKRQADITNELIEIVSGKEALKE